MGMLQAKDDEKKPLFRKWSKDNPNCTDVVKHIRLSASEEWILIECSECVAMLSAQSKVGSAFWEQVQQFKGKSLGLEIFPAKGKIGFDVQPSAVAGYWEWVDDNKVEFNDGEQKVTKTGFTSDLWDKMVQAAKEIIKEDEETKDRAGRNPSTTHAGKRTTQGKETEANAAK